MLHMSAMAMLPGVLGGWHGQWPHEMVEDLNWDGFDAVWGLPFVETKYSLEAEVNIASGG